MICEACEGEGYTKAWTREGGLLVMPCLECGCTGISSCCDAAGSANVEPRFKCAGCGSDGGGGLIRCRDCGQPLVFVREATDEEQREALKRAAMRHIASDPYKDERFDERACDRCGKLYRGPAVYCSLACALADA